MLSLQSTRSFSNVTKASRSPTQTATETRSKRLKSLTLNRAYLNRGKIALSIFDPGIPGTAAHLHSEGASWQECTDIEVLNFDYAVLIVRPGAARRSRAHMEQIAERLDGVAAEVTVYS